MTRTLFLGLDGATFHILDDLTRDRPGEGVVMPFLRQFMAAGFRWALVHRAERRSVAPAIERDC